MRKKSIHIVLAMSVFVMLISFYFPDNNFSGSASEKNLYSDSLSFYIPESREEIHFLVDSLLELEEVPFDYLNVLHACLYEKFYKNDDIASLKESVHATHASDQLYHTWETEHANPYDSVFNLLSADTTFELYLSDYTHPYMGVVTSPFGWRDGRPHKGIDVDLEVWDTLRAAFDGEVRVAKVYGGFGRAVIIRHNNGLETIYAHLHRIKVKSGDWVNAGDLIGLGGSSGHSTGSHLHFETRFLGRAIDPEIFIDFTTGMLKHDELIIKKYKKRFICYPKGAVFHTVHKGDYLIKIGNCYGVSVSEICKLNRISRKKRLKIGEKIRVI